MAILTTSDLVAAFRAGGYVTAASPESMEQSQLAAAVDQLMMREKLADPRTQASPERVIKTPAKTSIDGSIDLQERIFHSFASDELQQESDNNDELDIDGIDLLRVPKL